MPDPIRFGSEFDVSTNNANTQDRSSTTRLTDGRVLVVWTDAGSGSGDIKFAIFSADGVPLIGETTANVGTAGLQGAPRVAALADGTFVIVWESFAQDGSGDVLFRRFDSDGLGLDPADVVATTGSTGYQQDPTVVARPDGSFVIGWNEGNTAVTGLSSSTAAMVRDFASSGVAISNGVRVSGNWGGDFAPQLAQGGSCLMFGDDDRQFELTPFSRQFD